MLRAVLILFISLELIVISFLLFSKRHIKKAVRLKGPLYTKQGKIYDRNHKEVIIKAINYAELTPVGYVYQPPDVSNLPDVCKQWIAPPTMLDAKKVSDFGFNAVRLVINWDTLEPEPPVLQTDGSWLHNWDKAYVQAIDNAVKDLGKNHIGIILDMHQYLWSGAFKYIESEDGSGCSGGGIPAWLYPHPENLTFQQARCDFFADVVYSDMPIDPQEGFIEAWKYLSTRYKDDPWVIGANIINEPWAVKTDNLCPPETFHLDPFYQKVIRAIQEINPRLLFIIEDTQDYGDDVFGIKNPLPFHNIVYSFHLYTGNWNETGLERTMRFVKRARRWNVPLFIGEFDAFGYAWNIKNSYAPAFWKQEVDDMMQFFKKNDIHWAFWAYSGYQSLLDSPQTTVKKDLLEALQSGF